MKFRLLLLHTFSLLLMTTAARANKLFIPMDATGQTNHLKAYGIAFAAMQEGIPVDWLLNYEGGSFAIDNDGDIANLCDQAGVTYALISITKYERIIKEIKAPSFNGAVIRLETPPRIAVYTPPNKEPWDDAVTMALNYAGIPFDKLFADEVLAGDLSRYDWLHLHHEDFTGQYSKFWASYRNAEWYINDKNTMEAIATRNGYNKVSQLQLAVVKKIQTFVGNGGNLFAMCSATETFDIALAAANTDICDTPFDGDPASANANRQLDYSQCLAFKNFTVVTDAYSTGHSDIDFTNLPIPNSFDYFTLIAAPAKTDPVAAMLCQNHVTTVKGFMGQTTAFRKELLKPGVLVLGSNITVADGAYPNSGYNNNRAKYIHGEYRKGTWTFYGGHDPEAYKHMIGDPPTDLSQFPNSPGYRLILNNVLLTASKKKRTSIAIVDTPQREVERVLPQDTIAATVKMTPDPANNQLVFVFTPAHNNKDAATKNTITITNFGGVEVFKQAYTMPNVNVDLKDLPAGIYLVKVNGVFTGKIAKQ